MRAARVNVDPMRLMGPRKQGHPIEKMQAVWRLVEQGVSRKEVAQQTGVPRGTIDGWLAYPEMYDPFVDDVAVERALEGDVAVFRKLTNWERVAFLEGLDGMTYERLRILCDLLGLPFNNVATLMREQGYSYDGQGDMRRVKEFHVA